MTTTNCARSLKTVINNRQDRQTNIKRSKNKLKNHFIYDT